MPGAPCLKCEASRQACQGVARQPRMLSEMRPQSDSTHLPEGLRWKMVLSSRYFSGTTGLMTCSIRSLWILSLVTSAGAREATF